MNKPYKIAVIDYQLSNMFSIKNALSILGFEVEITSDYSTILSCDGAILPGVGSFPEAIDNIKELNLDNAIKDFIASGKTFVGVCLGFQLLFDKSDEIEDTFGLGILPGEVKSFSALNDRIRVPHVGWNNVKKKQMLNINNNLNPLKKFNDEEYFYFIHSCYVKPMDNNDIYTSTQYGGIDFCSSILKENIFACQFHPEKSGKKGIRILSEIFNQ